VVCTTTTVVKDTQQALHRNGLLLPGQHFGDAWEFVRPMRTADTPIPNWISGLSLLAPMLSSRIARSVLKDEMGWCLGPFSILHSFPSVFCSLSVTKNGIGGPAGLQNGRAGGVATTESYGRRGWSCLLGWAARERGARARTGA